MLFAITITITTTWIPGVVYLPTRSSKVTSMAVPLPITVACKTPRAASMSQICHSPMSRQSNIRRLFYLLEYCVGKRGQCGSKDKAIRVKRARIFKACPACLTLTVVLLSGTNARLDALELSYCWQHSNEA